ncbi:MAG: nucleotidyltransferase domain-containing protein [Gaiellaceae bacterium]
MFTVEERDRVRERLLELAEADTGIAAAAITGSYAVGKSDEWSDIDVALGAEPSSASPSRSRRPSRPPGTSWRGWPGSTRSTREAASSAANRGRRSNAAASPAAELERSNPVLAAEVAAI